MDRDTTTTAAPPDATRAQVRREAHEIVDAARAAGLSLRLLGG